MITWARIGFVFVALFAVTLVLLPFQLLGLAFDLKIRRYIPRYWHRTACFLLGIRIHVHGALEPRRPLMLACNHASWKDILVLGAVADVVFIAKMEVSEWPVFGTLAKLQKSIFVVREQKRRTGDQVNEIAERMADSEIVVLFPEGTTSDGNRLLEVKSSLSVPPPPRSSTRRKVWCMSSRWRSPIPASTAWPWAAIIGRSRHGRAISNLCRICSAS